jgi:hypothetical protein
MAFIDRSGCTGSLCFPPPVSGYKFKPYGKVWP